MIFNSLGSNYNFRFILKSLFSFGGMGERENLKKYLSDRYGGEAYLFYKGREAIKFALKILNLPEGSRVGITGFTCYVVYQAVVESGCVPVFVDISEKDLNFSLNELEKHKNLSALIIQNTLGAPCDAEGIQKYCKRNGICLIEDLAHSIGSIYRGGIEAGKMGDFTALSFSQDKSIDAVSGGALIIRSKDFKNRQINESFHKVSFGQQLKDRFYPAITFVVRKTYPFGLGKIIHYFSKKTGILSVPIEENGKIALHLLPGWYCLLIKYQFGLLEITLSHRKEIREIYKKLLKTELSGTMRFPILAENRNKLIKYLRGRNAHISDTWYDAPVSPKKRLEQTSYKKGMCSNSERISDRIINLPTHINISRNQALDLSESILKWKNIK